MREDIILNDALMNGELEEGDVFKPRSTAYGDLLMHKNGTLYNGDDPVNLNVCTLKLTGTVIKSKFRAISKEKILEKCFSIFQHDGKSIKTSLEEAIPLIHENGRLDMALEMKEYFQEIKDTVLNPEDNEDISSGVLNILRDIEEKYYL